MNEVLLSRVFLKILNMSISACWLVLAVVLLRAVLKKAPKWICVLLWGLVAIRLICPFSMESVLSLIPSAETVSPEIMTDWTPEVSTGIGSVDTVINPIITRTFAPEPSAGANPLQILIPAAALVWLAGIAVMLSYTAVSYLLLRGKVATAVLLRKNIYRSENVDSPFVLGIIRPRIYLPFKSDGQDPEYVIAHEQAHIRRKDHWWKPFGFLLLALHWFNPLMWLGYILLCRDIELACDEKVISRMDSASKADYALALVACSINRRGIAACPLAFGEVGVKERVRSVMNYKKPALWIIIAAAVICILVAACFLTDPVAFRFDGENNILVSAHHFDMRIADDAVAVEMAPSQLSELSSRLAGVRNAGKSDEYAGLTPAYQISALVNDGSYIRISGYSMTERDKVDIEWNGKRYAVADPDFQEYLSRICMGQDVASIGDPATDINTPDGSTQFAAAVLEVHDGYLLVKPEGVAAESLADKIEISLKERESWPIPQVGDSVLVVYDGNIQETYPARITGVYRVEIMNFDSGPVETVYGNMRTYYRNTDGTWQVDGRNYKYRLVITGRTPNAAVDSTFVYLSDLETIPFDRAWRAAGFSSNTEDYFSPDEAVLVELAAGESASAFQVGGVDVPQNGVITDGSGAEIVVESIDEAITEAILEKNAGDGFLDQPTGLIPAEAHYILGITSVSGTPLAGQTDHMKQITVYVQYAYHRYSCSGGKLEQVAGTGRPAMLIFSGNEEGGYTLREFREPKDGSLYAQEIREIFPEDIAAMILDPGSAVVDPEELEARCMVKAQEYVHKLLGLY